MAPLVVSVILVVVYQLAIATIPRVFKAMIGASTRPAAAQGQPRLGSLAQPATLRI